MPFSDDNLLDGVSEDINDTLLNGVDSNTDFLTQFNAPKNAPSMLPEKAVPSSFVQQTIQSPDLIAETAKKTSEINDIGEGIKRLINGVTTNYNRGALTQKIGKVASRLIFSRLDDKSKKKVESELKALHEQEAELIPAEPKSIFEKFAFSTAEQLPQLVNQYVDGLPTAFTSGIAAGTGAAIIGQAGPQAALPEEIITVPVATGAGFFAGLEAQAIKSTVETEAGLAREEFASFIDETGKPLDEGLVRVLSASVGVINGALEFVPFEKLLETFPGVKGLLSSSTHKLEAEAIKKIASNPSLRLQLFNIAKSYVTYVGSEAITETLQESSTALHGELGKYAQGGFIFEEPSELAKRALSAGYESMFSSSVLGLPGTALSSAHAVNNARNSKRAMSVFSNLKESVDKAHLSQDMTAKLVNEMGVKGDVFIDNTTAQTLAELPNTPPAIQDIMQNNADKITNGLDVSVPVTDVLSLESDSYKAIQDGLKLAENSVSLNEAKGVNETSMLEEYQTQKQNYDTELKRIEAETAALGFGEEYTKAYVSLLDSFVSRMSDEGLDKIEFLKKISISENKNLTDTLEQKVFHGSAQDFKEFKTEKISSGTGFTAFGHGLYFTTSPEVAEKYMDFAVAKTALRTGIPEGGTFPLGQLYEVEIPDRDRYLSLQGQMGNQSEFTTNLYKTFLTKFGADPVLMDIIENGTGQEFYDYASSKLGSTKKASEFLSSLGLKGLWYKNTSFSGTDNFVVFRGEDAKILKKYYQDKGIRGEVSISPDAYFINLFERKDWSTLLHETAHVFLEEMQAIYESKSGSESFNADYEYLIKWLEADKGIEKKHHERFADTFERYLQTGLAPSLELEGAFSRFRKWLLQVYGKIRDRVVLDAEIKGVLDRLLYVDTAMDIMFSDIYSLSEKEMSALNLDVNEKKYMRKIKKQIKEKAVLAMHKDGENAIRQNKKQFYKEAKAQVLSGDSKQVYAVLQLMEEDRRNRLDRQELLELYSEAYIQKLPSKYMTTARNGLSLAQAASIYGYNSIDEMLTDFVGTLPLKEAVDRRYKLLVSNFLKDLRPEDYVADIEEYRTYLDVVQKRLSSLSGKTVPKANLKKYANDFISGTRIEDLKPQAFVKAFKKAFSDERNSLIKGEYVEALQHIAKTKLRYETAILAIKAEKEVQNGLALIKKQTNNSQIEVSYRNAIAYLAGLKGLGVAVKAPSNLEELLNNSDSDVSFSDNLLKQITKRRLTVADFRELISAVSFLSHSGDMKLRHLADKATIEAIAQQFVAQNQGREGIKKATKFTLIRKAQDLSKAFFSYLDSLLYLTDRLDGFKGLHGLKSTIGVAQEFFHSRARDARNKEINLFMAKEQELKPIIKDIRKIADRLDKQGITNAVPEAFTRDGQHQWTGENIIALALNRGSKTNIERIFSGYPDLSALEVNKLLSLLTVEDWRSIQKMWDIIDSLEPDTSAVYRKINNADMSIVEPVAFSVHGEEFKGGYYPIVYDFKLASADVLAETSAIKDMALSLEKESLFRRPVVASQHTLIRNKRTALPLKLELGVTTNHVATAIHYITHAEYIRDANALLRNATFSSEAKRLIGSEKYQALFDAIRYIGSPNPMQLEYGENRLLQKAKRLTILHLIGYNIRTALKTGFSSVGATYDIGIKNMVKGMKSIVFHPVDHYRAMLDLSTKMRDRDKHFSIEMRRLFNSMNAEKKQFYFGSSDITFEDVQHAGTFMVRMADIATVMPIWYGAYWHKLAETHNLGESIKFADLAVERSQPSADPLELTKFHRSGGLMGLYNLFTSYTVGKYGQRQREFFQAWREKKITNSEYFVYNMYEAILPILGMNLLLEWISGDDTGNEEWQKIVFDSATQMFLQGMPVLNNIFTGYKVVSGTAIQKGVETMFKPVKSLVKYLDEQDDDTRDKLIWSTAEFVAFVSGIPFTRIAKGIKNRE